jgi:hypothetical protein
MQHDTVYWEALQKVHATRRLSVRQIAAKCGISPGYASRIFAGKVQCPERILRKIAALLFDSAEEQKNFINLGLEQNDWLRLGHRFSVRLAAYGFLEKQHFKDTVTLSGKSGMSGPSGFLVDCFARLMHFMGQEGLEQPLKRVGLRQLISQSSRPNGEVVLSHLAALNVIRTSHFFCTPISIGVSGVMLLRNLQENQRKSFVKQIRDALSAGSTAVFEQLYPICMENEVGHYYARSLFESSPRISTSIEDFTIDGCCRALEVAAETSRQGRVPVLIADELTCYLVLKELQPDAALLFGEDLSVPRFYFAFSVSRADQELTKELGRASELYLRTDSHFIVERYRRMYFELLHFAEGLHDCVGKTWLAKKAKQKLWVDQVCGIHPTATDSMLISKAWVPILASLERPKASIRRKQLAGLPQ